MLEIGGSTRLVLAELPVDTALTVTAGAAVEVELPDGGVVAGTVTAVGVVAITPTGDGNPYREVEVALGETGETGLTETPVDVRVAGETAAGVLAVPTSALVALQGGGYAVEVVDGTSTRLVGVEPGLFADGFVEITGDLQAGTTVAVPQ